MSKTITLKLKKLDEGLPTPVYANPGDAGLDLYAAKDVTLQPGQRVMIPTALPLPFLRVMRASCSRVAVWLPSRVSPS